LSRVSPVQYSPRRQSTLQLVRIKVRRRNSWIRV